MKAAAQFLETEHATEDDIRLVTQVKIWSVYGEIFDCFGTNITKPLRLSQIPPLRRFAIALDSWHADWRDKFGPNNRVGNYPAKGVGLHFYFAKLYLYSHAFRGLHNDPSSTVMLPELEETANAAVLAAMSILGIINSDTEMQSYLNGLPLCFDMMIIFSVIFLLKVMGKYSCTVWVDKARVLNTVKQTVGNLEKMCTGLNSKHLLVSAVASLRSHIDKSHVEAPVADNGGAAAAQQRQSPGPSSQQPSDAAAHSLQIWDDVEFLDLFSNLSEPSSWLAHGLSE